MARIKGPVRVPQLVAREGQVTGSFLPSHDDKLDAHIAAESSRATRIQESPIIKKSRMPISLLLRQAAEKAQNQHQDRHTYSFCPTCKAEFVDMPVQDFREHVESCSPVINDGASDTSTLSDPPAELPELPPLPDHLSTDLVNPNGVERGEEADVEFPEPYEQESASYPETKPLPNRDADDDLDQEELQKIQLPAITDVNKFFDSLEDMQDLSYENLYHRVLNAQQAMISWQNEWMDLESFTNNVQPFPPGSTQDFIFKQMESKTFSKEPTNPRLPKGFPVGTEDDLLRLAQAAKYQDQLEASVYGYKWDPHHTKIGKQDPIAQRIVESRADGRDLRQRVPTQRAAEGDFDTTPESGDENGKRRGRGQRIRYDSMGVDGDGGRGARQRFPSSRVDSLSRDQTPVKTFASGKKIGRPRKNHITNHQSQGKPSSSRLKEYEAAYDMDDDQDIPRQTTEQYSRPTTSSSMEPSFVMGTVQDQSPGKGKKRSNTSDFEDALPSNKRIKSNGANGLDQSGGKISRRIDGSQGAEPNSRSVKMRTIQKESWAKDDGTRKSNLSNSMQERWAQAKKEGRKTLGPSTTTKKEPSTSTKTKAKKGPKVKGEGEISAASLNMLNRWRKKREAIERGEKPPNIGRYAKAKSAASATPAATQTPEHSNAADRTSSANLIATIKSQQEPIKTPDTNPGEDSVQTASTGEPVASAPAKKRNGRQKKDIKAEESAQNGVSDAAADADSITNLLETTSQEKANDSTAAEEADQDLLPTEPRNGRRKKAEGLTSSTEVSSPQTKPSSGSGPVRISTRIRKPTSRQASAAASTQSSTRQSSRVSGNTVTPTPAPFHGPEAHLPVKQDQIHNITILKTRRGIKGTVEADSSTPGDSAVEDIAKRKRGNAAPILPSTEFPDAMESGDGETDEDLAAKRRRGGRVKRETADSTWADFRTPAERPLARGKGGRFVQSSSSSSSSGGAIVVEDKVPPREWIQGPSTKRRRGGQSRDVTDALPAEGDKKGKSRVRLTSGSKTTIKDEHTTNPAIENQLLDSEEAALLAAKKAKSEKMSQIMKSRWSRGDMASVMERKKANNRARKEAAASSFGPIVASSFVNTAPIANADGFIAPPPKVRKPTGAAAHKRNLEKQAEQTIALPSGDIATTVLNTSPRKPSQYEIFQGLSSPTAGDSPIGRRAKRPAALKAQQSFSSINDDDEQDFDNNEDQEDDQQQIEKQLQVDATSGPDIAGATDTDIRDNGPSQQPTDSVPGILLGKRKRKPVMNLEEAMRLERGEEDDFDEE